MKSLLEYPYRNLLLIIPIFVVGMVIGSFGYLVLFKNFILKDGQNKKVVINSPLPTVLEDGKPTSKDAKIYNFLLMGQGGEGHSGGGLMDAIILVSVNITDKKAKVISIPRDLWFSGHKINSDPSVKDAVAGVTGLSINKYMSIDFTQFKKMIDSLGGVEVDIKKTYIDNFYPVKGKEGELCGKSPQEVADLHAKYSGFELEKQFTCRYEKIEYGIGLNHMDGETALKYVRSRHGDGDFGRSRRQFEVLKAILQKANVKSLSLAFDFVKTDLTLSEAETLLTEIANPLEYSVSYIGLSDENVLTSSKSSAGAYILVPKSGEGNFNGIKEFIKSNL